MTSRDPVQKQRATEKKEERKAEAEWNKQEAREHNAAAKQAAKVGGESQYTTAGGGAPTSTFNTQTHTHSVANAPAHPTGTDQMSAFPGHGTGEPYGGQVDATGLATTTPTGLPGQTTGHNPRV